MLEWLNQYSGFLSLLAVLAAIFIPIIIYQKNKRDKRKDLMDEYEAMHEENWSHQIINGREWRVRQRYLEKKIRK